MRHSYPPVVLVCSLDDGVLDFKENVISEDNESTSRSNILSLNLNEVSQCVMKGNTAKDRNNIELQFHENDELEAQSDQLVQISFYVPPGADADMNDKDMRTPAEEVRTACFFELVPCQIRPKQGNE